MLCYITPELLASCKQTNVIDPTVSLNLEFDLIPIRTSRIHHGQLAFLPCLVCFVGDYSEIVPALLFC